MARRALLSGLAAVVLAVVTALAGCSGGGVPSGKLYPLRGEVVSVVPDRNEITLRHDAIAGFMQAMTMPFPVARRSLLDGIAKGDRVEGVLLVEDARYAILSLAKVDGDGAPAATGAAAP